MAFSRFVEEQLRQGTRSLYADSVKYLESILLTDVLRSTDGNQSQAAVLLGITRGCLRSKLRLHGIMISSSVAIQDPAQGSEGDLATPAGTKRQAKKSNTRVPVPMGEG